MPTMEALREFARHIINQYAWDRSEPDGGDVQDMAAKLGLIIQVPYDPQKHGDSEYSDFVEPGEPWFEFSPALSAPSPALGGEVECLSGRDAPSDEHRRMVLREAWQMINAWIIPGPLPGDGTDRSAQRNGMILAANILLDALKQEGLVAGGEQVRRERSDQSEHPSPAGAGRDEGWLPIESAPKDGTHVLLVDDAPDREVVIGYWDENTDWRHIPGEWPVTPLAWRPLPTPPVSLTE